MHIKNFLNNVSKEDFNYPQYLLDNKQIIDSKALKEPVYKVESTSKASRIALEIILGILSVFFLPYGLYRLVHLIGGKIIVPAQRDTEHAELRKMLSLSLAGKECKIKAKDNNGEHEFILFDGIAKQQKGGVLSTFQQNTLLVNYPPKEDQSDQYLVAKRITVLVDGKKIDAMILGKKCNLNNKRWTLFSNGNGTTYEGNLAYNSNTIVEQIEKLGTNFLLYNYQGVGESEGWSTRDGMVNAHKAMLKFLEDDKKGIGAKEIIQWGVSIGGGVQGHAMRSHKLKKEIKYVFIKNQTFSRISQVPGPFLGALIRFFGWEFSSLASSKKLNKRGKPEIVIQTTSVLSDHPRASQIAHDGVIPKEGSHAWHLLKTKPKWKHKIIVPTLAGHFGDLGETAKEKILKAITFALQPHYDGYHPELS